MFFIALVNNFKHINNNVDNLVLIALKLNFSNLIILLKI